MKVCHICSNYDKFYTNLMEELKNKGINLRVFYFRAKERGWPEIKSSYVDVRLNYKNWHRYFFRLKEKYVLDDFFKFYIDYKFDIVHAHTLFSNGYIALKLKKKWKLPYIVAVRDVDVNIFFKYRLTIRKLGIKILKEAEIIVFLSPEYKKLVISKYIPKYLRKEFSNKSIIIPNGVDKYFLYNKKLRYGLNQNRPINIITVGYICKRKNQLTVCKAIEQLNKLGIKTTYIVVGKILDYKIFRKLKKYSFVNYIPFLSKEKLIDKYRKADIYIMPSVTETFGITYLEAMSQGLPIIYTKGQGFDGQFEEGKVGYSVRFNSIKDIVERIIDILDNYETISNNCINEVNKFDWEKIADEYIQIYLRYYNN